MGIVNRRSIDKSILMTVAMVPVKLCRILGHRPGVVVPEPSVDSQVALRKRTRQMAAKKAFNKVMKLKEMYTDWCWGQAQTSS